MVSLGRKENNRKLGAVLRKQAPLAIFITGIVGLLYRQPLLIPDVRSLKFLSFKNIPKPESYLAATHVTVPLLDLPGVTSVVLNIGSNIDPVMPKESTGPCAIGIAFEPIVPHLIRTHPQIYVVPAAVVAVSGGSLVSMYTYNQNGVSSSLSKASTTDQFWNNNKNRGDGKSKLVPSLTLETILQSIPVHIDIPYIKTDMQGYDFAAVRAGRTALLERGIKNIETETVWNDSYQYEDVYNDLCRDWLPYMTELGYIYDFRRENEGYCPPEKFETLEKAQQTCNDFISANPTRQKTNLDTKYTCNVMWRLASIPSTGNTDPYDFPTLPAASNNRRKVPYTYTTDEYNSCFK